MSQFTHILIKQTAMEICGAAYEELARDNVFYRVFPNQKLWVKKNWPGFMQEARDALVEMLTLDDVPEEQKDLIQEALVMDRLLPRDQKVVQHHYH